MQKKCWRDKWIVLITLVLLWHYETSRCWNKFGWKLYVDILKWTEEKKSVQEAWRDEYDLCLVLVGGQSLTMIVYLHSGELSERTTGPKWTFSKDGLGFCEICVCVYYWMTRIIKWVKGRKWDRREGRGRQRACGSINRERERERERAGETCN